MKICEECGKEFKPKRKEQKFCSHKCSVKYNRRNFSFGTIPGWETGYLQNKRKEISK